MEELANIPYRSTIFTPNDDKNDILYGLGTSVIDSL